MGVATAQCAEPTSSVLVERWFAAPPDRLFTAYEDPKLLIRWFGPLQVKRWLSFEHCLAEGAALTYGLVTEEGDEIWGRCDFTVVERDSSIAFISSVTDNTGTPIRPIHDRDWMLRVFTSVTLSPLRNGTLLRVAATSYGAGAVERAFFSHMSPGLRARFWTSLVLLSVILGERNMH